MKCPRCNVDLQKVKVTEIEIDLCPKCEGSWYDTAELGRMFRIQDKTMKSSDLAPTLKPGEPVDLEKPINCPQCEAAMERNRYLSECPVIVDRCAEHGIWLDGGELGQLLDYTAKSVDKWSVKMASEKNPGGLLDAIRRLFKG